MTNGSFKHLRHLRIQMIFVGPGENNVPATTLTSTSNNRNPALLTLHEKLPDIRTSPQRCSKRNTRQMLLKAFAETAVTLDIDCYSGILYEPDNSDCVPPHKLRWRFSMDLVKDEV